MKIKFLSPKQRSEYSEYIARDFYKHWDMMKNPGSLQEIEKGWGTLEGANKERKLAQLARRYAPKPPEAILAQLKQKPQAAKKALMWALANQDHARNKDIAYLGALVAFEQGAGELEGRFIHDLATTSGHQSQAATDYARGRVAAMKELPSPKATAQEANYQARFAWGYMRHLNLKNQADYIAIMAVGFSYDPFGEMAGMGVDAMSWACTFKSDNNSYTNRRLTEASARYMQEVPKGKNFTESQLLERAKNLLVEYPANTPDGYPQKALISQQLNALSPKRVAHNTQRLIEQSIQHYRHLSPKGKNTFQRVLKGEKISLNLGSCKKDQLQQAFFDILWKNHKDEPYEELSDKLKTCLPKTPSDIHV